MSYIAPGIRRLCLALDADVAAEVAADGAHPAGHERGGRRALTALLRTTCRDVALDRMCWDGQSGDGELMVLPPGIDEARVVADFVHALRVALAQANRRLGQARLRLRLAIHQGIARVGESGYAGRAVLTVTRLRDSRELKAALAGSDADLALIVSDHVFHDMFEQDCRGLTPDQFERVRITMPDGCLTVDAWISVPER